MTPRAPPGLRWRGINTIQAFPEEPMELTTPAKPQSPVEDPLDFRDVRSGPKESAKDAHSAPSGAEQAKKATTNEQGTAKTCPCPEEAPKTVQDMLATPPQPRISADNAARATTIISLHRVPSRLDLQVAESHFYYVFWVSALPLSDP